MAILIGLALGVGLLYAWLSGNWFGRVLAFLVLAALCGSAGFGAGVTLAVVQPAAIATAYAPAPVHEPMTGKEIADAYRYADQAAAAAPRAPVSPIVPILGAVIGVALAWPISGIPIYYRRSLPVKA